MFLVTECAAYNTLSEKALQLNKKLFDLVPSYRSAQTLLPRAEGRVPWAGVGPRTGHRKERRGRPAPGNASPGDQTTTSSQGFGVQLRVPSHQPGT